MIRMATPDHPTRSIRIIVRDSSLRQASRIRVLASRYGGTWNDHVL